MTGNVPRATARLPDGTTLEVTDLSVVITRPEIEDDFTAIVTDSDLRDAGERVLAEFSSAVGKAMITLTAEERAKTAPHQHRPELRGDGLPRKRGKGKR